MFVLTPKAVLPQTYSVWLIQNLVALILKIYP
jgi:hypothetical protein